MAFLDETGLAELWSLITEKDDALAAADVKIATGSYTGTGTFGSSKKNTLTFDFEPKLVFICQSSKYSSNELAGTNPVNSIIISQNFIMRSDSSSNGFGASSHFAWSNSGKTITWYSSDSNQAQGNLTGIPYYYIAIG